MPSKSAADTMDALKFILNRIDNASSGIGRVSLLMMKSFKSTTSDSASTEKHFNNLLQVYRAEILPVLMEERNRLTLAEREEYENMYNFFCQLHPLVHFAEACAKGCGEAERGHFGNKPTDDVQVSRDHSTTVRLMRTASKALARGGCDKSGIYGLF